MRKHTLYIYRDPAYPLRPQLQRPFKGVRRTRDQIAWNRSQVRIAVEWIFNDIVNYFKLLDFKKNLKIGLSPIGKTYIVSALLHNTRTVLYGNLTSKYFDVDPPTIANYFV